MANRTVTNERIKHTASFLNTAAGALIATGILTPNIALVLGMANTDWTLVLTIALICSLLAIGLHLAGNGLLGAMEE